MNTQMLSIYATAALVLSALSYSIFGAEAPAKTDRPAIYDENADAAKQISAALSVAKKENKGVLLPVLDS